MLFNFVLTLFTRSACVNIKIVSKTCFQGGFKLKMSFIKKNFISKEKSGTVAKVKLITKIKKQSQLYSGTLVFASYCYCGDNT